MQKIHHELTKSARKRGVTVDVAARRAVSELLPTAARAASSDGSPREVRLPNADRSGDFMVYPSSFGHAALYSRKNQIVHAPGGNSGVRVDWTRSQMVPTGVTLFRVKNQTRHTRAASVKFALQRLGYPYRSNYFGPKAHDSKYYCSQLVWASYKFQGTELDGGGWWNAVSPGELTKSKNAAAYRWA